MQKAISILLCILMLASSTNVTYAKHFCGDHEMLSVITIGEKHLTCEMKTNSNTCGDETLEDHDCCKNKYENVEIDDDYSLTYDNAFISIPFVKSFVSVFVLQQVLFNNESVDVYADYDPPPIDKDIPVLYQVFVI